METAHVCITRAESMSTLNVADNFFPICGIAPKKIPLQLKEHVPIAGKEPCGGLQP